MTATGEDDLPPMPASRLVDEVVGPAVKAASDAFLAELDGITVEDAVPRRPRRQAVFGGVPAAVDFAI